MWFLVLKINLQFYFVAHWNIFKQRIPTNKNNFEYFNQNFIRFVCIIPFQKDSLVLFNQRELEDDMKSRQKIIFARKRHRSMMYKI